MMRKRLLSTIVFIATAMTGIAQTGEVVTVPYSSDLGIPSASSTATGNIDPAWTAVDADTGSGTNTNAWTYARNTYITGVDAQGGVSLKTIAYFKGDDWLISPAISLEEGKNYKISWYSYSTAAACSYKAMMSENVTDAEFATMQEENADITYPQALDARLDEGKLVGEVTTVKNSMQLSEFTYSPEKTGDYRFGFWAFTKNPTAAGMLCITKFQIVEDGESPEIPDEKVTPGAITDFTATPVGEELKVDLTWKLPETDAKGNAIEPSVITAVKLWRGEELIATLDGTATSYTDNVPAAGFYTYKVAAVGDEEGEAATVTTSYVGEKKPYPIPYTADFSNADMTKAFWTTVDANGDGKGWKYEDSGFTFDNYSTAITEDDWLITPALAFSSAGTYRMSWTGNCGNGKLSFVLGKENTVTAMTGDEALEIGQIELSTYSAVEKNLDFKITEPGNYYIGIKCDNNPSEGYSYYTKGFSVTELSEEDLYQTITIPEEGSMVFSSKDALGFGEVEGLSAYIATVEDNMLSIEEVESVPASTGVILKGDSGEYKVPYISNAEAIEGNVIKAAVNGQKVSAGAYIYGNGEKGIGFYKTDAATEVPAGSGYLPDTIGDVNFISENGGSTVKTTQIITVGEDGSMTYSLNRGLDFSSAEGIEAYIVDKIDGDFYTVKEIEKVPASTGIIIKAKAGDYEVAYCDDVEAVADNKLEIVTPGVRVLPGSFIYQDGQTGLGFYKLTEATTLPENSVYLPADVSTSEFIKETNDITTGVSEISTEASLPKAVYDLSGRKVSYPERGIYIIDGRTVIVK
ncbi:MAG: hypothetical protein K2H96_05075 [Muribaculaceae bacterium]|nr:hypothetical protein [Muribaculaceae bacterium]